MRVRLTNRYDAKSSSGAFDFLQIARDKPFSEPSVNRRQQFGRLLRLALVTPEPRHAHCGAEFFYLMGATPTGHLDANTRLTIHMMAVRKFDTHSDDAPGSSSGPPRHEPLNVCFIDLLHRNDAGALLAIRRPSGTVVRHVVGLYAV